MGTLTPTYQPVGAAFLQWTHRIMDVILHLGAHRTATTSFQDYMRRHRDLLAEQGVAFWGPQRTRRGLHAGILPAARSPYSEPSADCASRRIADQLSHVQQKGMRHLVVSDENMIGTVRDNIHQGALYPQVASRLARFAEAYDGRIKTVLFSPRSLELYWCSALAYGVGRGVPVPDRAALRSIAMARRSWRDVIADIACAVPNVAVRIIPFERYAGHPHRILRDTLGIDAPADSGRHWLNPVPKLPELRRLMAENGRSSGVLPFGMGRWNPFANDEHAALRELYADDMMWLAAGADGLATLTEDRQRHDAGPTLPPVIHRKGRCDELEERKLARPG
ncbi:MAG: hypothetical protein WBV78_10480 [Roseobacter sp.]